MSGYGCKTAVNDYREVLNDPKVDAVSICTHTDMHYKIAIAAMRAGKDVLSEKLQNDISYVIKTTQILEGIYESSETGKETVFLYA